MKPIIKTDYRNNNKQNNINFIKFMRYYLIILHIFILSSCGGGSYRSTNSGNEESSVTEGISSARQQGYNQGYDDGYRAGYGWCEHGVFYTDQNNYQTEDGQNTYKRGYSEGYDEGYNDGEAKIIAERKAEREAREAHYAAMEAAAEEERRKNDFHNWEDEDVRQFYAEFSAYNDDDAKNKHYIYKKIDDRYFYEIDLGFDTYEVIIEYKLESKFYKVRGSNVFLEFRFEPYLYRWDEGVLDCSGSKGVFYKKPS